MAFLFTQKKFLNEIIMEKETKMRETLRMIGVGSVALFGSWLVAYGLIFGAVSFVFAWIAKTHVFPASDAGVVFVFFFLWCLSFTSFALFLHSFFNNARLGGLVGIVIMFSQWILFAALNKREAAPPTTMAAIMVLPNCALSVGLHIMGKYEAAQHGATWKNISDPIYNSSLAAVLAMFAFDTVFWCFAGWYFDRVLPKEFGVRLPWYFLCRCRRRRFESGGSVPGRFDEENWSAVCVLPEAAEKVSEAVRGRSTASGVEVRVKNLQRTFTSGSRTVVAVDGLTMTMYENQVLVLLGHNGAGKSTAIHMLTGLIEPTAGDALICGFSILTHMQEIRRSLGVCPQHDVLWPELTVIEHLEINASLRLLPSSMIRDCSLQMAERVGLEGNLFTRAGCLSGGQRRKLSLSLALLGSPAVCFLDEPTSGLDPFSRRFIWDFVRGFRVGRVVVITTHFMDEADILGDRIAIMSLGVLQCCGSSLFLKNRLGAGCRIIFSRLQKAEDEVAEQRDLNCDMIVQAVQRHVGDAEQLADVGAELTIRLPLGSAALFPDMFQELDVRKEELGIQSYGISMVSLEEVFFRVANGDAALFSHEHDDRDSWTPTFRSIRTPAEVTQESRASQDRLANRGCGVSASHLRALFVKRARYARRDFRAVCCSVILPVCILVVSLGVLQAFRQQAPPVSLDFNDQYGPRTEVPINVGSGVPSWAADLRSSQASANLIATDAPAQLMAGAVFGRNYSAGQPADPLCQADKCERDAKCHQRLGVLPISFWDALVASNTFGLGLSCKTTPETCQDTVTQACKNDGELCVKHCQSKGTFEVTREMCQEQCDLVCKSPYANGFCELVQAEAEDPKKAFAYMCPLGCADPLDDDTCSPGSVCHQALGLLASDPPRILSVSRKVFEEGLGRPISLSRYGAVLLSGEASVGTAVTVLYNTTSIHAVPTFLNLATGALKAAFSKGSTITVVNHPLPRASEEVLQALLDSTERLASSINVIIAFSWIPAAIVAYVVREREAHQNSKHQQFVSGVGVFSYWFSNWLWDSIICMIPLLCSIVLMHLFDLQTFSAPAVRLPVFLCFLGYGLAISPFSYLISFLFSKHTTAQVLALVINFVTGLLLLILSFVLSGITTTADINDVLMWGFRIFPAFCMGHGLFMIATMSLIADFEGAEDKTDYLRGNVAGWDILYIFIAAPVYFVLVVAIDSLLNSPVVACCTTFHSGLGRRSLTPNGESSSDEDVRAEVDRVLEAREDADVCIRLRMLRKVYRTPEGQPKIAVRGLSFALHHGECFGFLGNNGAGKTTTLNMLVGLTLPSGGSATLFGFDVVREQSKLRRFLGCCPQQNSLLDLLTVREHLELYGRIKCIPRAELAKCCDAVVRDMSLTGNADKTACTLSGGNKRKLTLAIAVIGAPPVLLLDEPSTGVDPTARRQMWGVISGLSTRRKEGTVVLTTHIMEEAEALCSRIGIMVGGRLRCLGSNQHIKARFGMGYELEARFRTHDVVPRHGRLPPVVTLENLEAVSCGLGDPNRAVFLRGLVEKEQAGNEPSAVARIWSMDVTSFLSWWALQDRSAALMARLLEAGMGVEDVGCVISPGGSLNLRLSPGVSLSEAFRCLEAAKSDGEILLDEYGIGQTTLEQIFNSFAVRYGSADHT